MRLAVIGNGNMGRILQSIASSEIVAVIENFEYQVLNDDLNIDVIIDFSHRNNLKYIYDYALKHKCKVVIATTNLNDEDKELIYDLANYVPVMLDSNYSYGILLIKEILINNLDNISKFDIELIETHHKYKKDAPSGTMKNIESILDSKELHYNTHSLRAGTVRGEHSIILYGDDEIIEIKHTSLSRKIYALGALEASKWLMCQEKGLFSYKDCIFSK